MNELQRRLRQPLFNAIISLLPKDIPIYLVGGAVRDAFLNRPSYDLDFVTGPEAMAIARQLADNLSAAYFPLDRRRKVARLVLKPDDRYGLEKNHPIRVDFSAFQGPDLESDLRGRDFTFNAMAVDIRHLDAIVDPLKGAADLARKRLRACSPESFDRDPVRILRAVRFSVDLGLKMLPDSLGWIREAKNKLQRVSSERIRDEFFRILSNVHPGTSLRIMDNLEILGYFLPELIQLKDVKQSQPHVLDAYSHTIKLLDHLEDMLDVLQLNYDPEKADNLSMGLVVMKLGRYHLQLAEHLNNSLNPGRPHRGLLFMAGLYHDVGKQVVQTVDGEGKTRFIGHEEISSRLVKLRGEELRLSNLEIERLVKITKNHMRPAFLSHADETPSRKAIYHFFRDTGAAGVDICLLSLADMLATYGATLPPERWARHLEVVRSLLEAWWEEKDQKILPAALLNGYDLRQALDLVPGPLVGYLLEAIREAQVNHEISNRDEAIRFAEALLSESNENRPTA